MTDPFERSWLFLKTLNQRDRPTDPKTDILHTDPAGFTYPITRHSESWGKRAGMNRGEGEFQRELDPPPQTEKQQERELRAERRLAGNKKVPVRASKNRFFFNRMPDRPRTEYNRNALGLEHRFSGPMAGSATLPPPEGSPQAQIDAKLEMEGEPQTGRGRLIDFLVEQRNRRLSEENPLDVQ